MRVSAQISGLFGLGLVNQAQRPQVQVLHAFAAAIKLTKDALASLCSSTAWMRGRIESRVTDMKIDVEDMKER